MLAPTLRFGLHSLPEKTPLQVAHGGLASAMSRDALVGKRVRQTFQLLVPLGDPRLAVCIFPETGRISALAQAGGAFCREL